MSKFKKGDFSEFRLYASIKAEIEKLIDGVLAPVAGYDEEGSFPMDVYEEGDDVVIELEIPGVDPQDVTIEATDRMVEIKGKRTTLKQKYQNCVRLERASGSFRRVIFLEKPVNVLKATATLKDGVLLVRLPRVKEKRKKRIINID